MLFDVRLSQVDLCQHHPDCARLAAALGADGLVAEHEPELRMAPQARWRDDPGT